MFLSYFETTTSLRSMKLNWPIDSVKSRRFETMVGEFSRIASELIPTGRISPAWLLESRTKASLRISNDSCDGTNRM